MNKALYPAARRENCVEQIHGETIHDPYRWLEKPDSDEVRAWDAAQAALVDANIDAQDKARSALLERLESLWRYDDESTPRPCLLSDRLFYQTKSADEDKWVLCYKSNAQSEGRVLLDPNTWAQTETLDFWTPSPDGKYIVYGRANAGDEAAVAYIMVVDSGELLPDDLQGWRQGFVQWLHDNSGFYYSSKPIESEKEEGGHHYYHRVWFHHLGSSKQKDILVLADDEVKEHYHWSSVSEDGKWLLLYRCQFDQMQVFLQELGTEKPMVDITGPPSNSFYADVVEGKILVMTDWQAPKRQVMVADVDKADRKNWKVLIPEHHEDTLGGMSLVGGRLYLSYQHCAATRIDVYDLQDNFLKSVQLPGVGTASVSGLWSKPTVWIGYVSYNHVNTVYQWDFESQALSLHRKVPIDIDTSDMVVQQLWYPSKDGTQISMYLFHKKDVKLDGRNPVYLTGYGGFNISRSPMFSTPYALWVKAGGVVAVCNLRGGGEYGKAWHEAGMRLNKQNVFDDFIAAGEWLIENKWTQAKHLAIIGGSNGGLLVGACAVQRPDLFGAVLCQVPLLDMVRFHKFGLANIWTPEYGNADDEQMTAYIHAYSPYHNVNEGQRYPAMLITGSENDARTDPLHARKFAAALQWASSEDSGPILLSIQRESGHMGGVTIKRRAQQWANYLAFLSEQTGLGI